MSDYIEISFRALACLNQDISEESQSVKLHLSGNKTVALPSDYLSWSNIGIMKDNGQISIFKTNNA